MSDGKDLNHLLETLDEKSRALLWHLWWHRHADISELRRAINASSDIEILHRMKDVINGKAIEILGRPVLSFEESKVDSLTGQKFFFRWWFLDDIPCPVGDMSLADVFQEGERFVIIAQIPGAPETFDAKFPKVEYRNGVLRVTLCKGQNT